MAKSRAQIERESTDAVLAQMEARGIIEEDNYCEWNDGDLVSIAREPGVFTFHSVRVDEDGRPLWANVWGGIKGQEASRSFEVDRLETFGKIKRRGRRKKAV